jgi:hypothetical protein
MADEAGAAVKTGIVGDVAIADDLPWAQRADDIEETPAHVNDVSHYYTPLRMATRWLPPPAPGDRRSVSHRRA